VPDSDLRPIPVNVRQPHLVGINRDLRPGENLDDTAKGEQFPLS
jgi:hypothetical protein